MLQWKYLLGCRVEETLSDYGAFVKSPYTFVEEAYSKLSDHQDVDQFAYDDTNAVL